MRASFFLATLAALSASPLGASALLHPPWLPRVNYEGLTGLTSRASYSSGDAAVRSKRMPASSSSSSTSTSITTSSLKLPPGIPPYTTKWFDQTVDHFNYETSLPTWKQRYLVYGGSYRPGGPLLFYTGNEGSIDNFYSNTGFMFTLADKFGGYVVFAEHRYFGQSWPFGTAKESFKPENRGYLTVEQALRDYAVLVPYVLNEAGLPPTAAVIAVGGSYGGMLSYWFRLKYPGVVTGALAASAPVLQYEGITPPEVFNQIASTDFVKAGGDACANSLRQGIIDVNTMSSTSEGRARLTTEFGLCSAMTEDQAGTLLAVVYNGLTYMAMTDYPEAADFLQPMPAWPVNAACEKVLAANSTVGALVGSLSVYYNYTGQTPCYNLTGAGTSSAGWLGDSGWDYLACTSQLMPMSSDGVHDIFLPAPWSLSAYVSQCKNGPWAVNPNPYWSNQAFGTGIQGAQAVTNVIASQGALDPWSGGGILPTTAPKNAGLTAILIADGAHHLDLRSPNPNDPRSVVEARAKEIQTIQGWLTEHAARQDL